jgi:hypothetical protein
MSPKHVHWTAAAVYYRRKWTHVKLPHPCHKERTGTISQTLNSNEHDGVLRVEVETCEAATPLLQGAERVLSAKPSTVIGDDQHLNQALNRNAHDGVLQVEVEICDAVTPLLQVSCLCGTHSRRRLVHMFRRPIELRDGLLSLIIRTLPQGAERYYQPNPQQ